MRRILLRALALAALLLALFGLCAADDAEVLESGSWQYTLNENGEAVTARYLGDETEVTVPASLDGHPVAVIGQGTFGSVSFPQVDKTIRKITLSEGIREIDDDSFFSCQALEEVVLPESLTCIGKAPFQWCERLGRVNLPGSLTFIDDLAFYGTALREISLPASLQGMGSNPFAHCGALTDIRVAPDHPVYETVDGVLFEKESRRLVCYPGGLDAARYEIPDGTPALGGDCFYGARFSTLVIPDSLTVIEGNPFQQCASLAAFDIPRSHPGLASRSGVLFTKDLSTLIAYPCARPNRSYTVPKQTRTIGRNAFSSVKTLEKVTITGGVEIISDGAFNACRSVREVRMAEGVREIQSSAFVFCPSLSRMNLPASLEKIADQAIGQTAAGFTAEVVKGSYAEEWCRGHGIRCAAE
ncbi:MAG: leucine-rich repeat domain-containing protein [Clostridia bacterium]|nr:leucine-rich repeat domain-containing protein [Clostridia bacterium]